MALYAERLGAPASQIGWLMTGYSAMQFVFTPVWGRLSDRHGRRPLLLASIAMTAVGFLGYALAPSFAWLLASRLFAGAATANIAIAQAYIADVTPPEGRARGMGIIGAAFGLGFVLGPAIGGLLSTISLSAPGYVAAALAAVNGVAAFFILPEPGTHVRAERRARFAALLEELGRPGHPPADPHLLPLRARLQRMEADLRAARGPPVRARPEARQLRLRLHRGGDRRSCRAG